MFTDQVEVTRQTFMKIFFTQIETIQNDSVLIGGDWNVVLNESLDTFRYRGVNRPHARNKILDKMLLHDLNDIWRELNPTKRQHTWRKRGEAMRPGSTTSRKRCLAAQRTAPAQQG